MKNSDIRSSKKVIFDLLVQFEDGSIANVEIQRMGIAMPSKRSAVYSADIVSRQFATAREQCKADVDYDMIQPVYTIIIFEKSNGVFLESDKYIHHFQQRSDTGIEMEFLQYYDYICLDIFKEKHPRTAGELEKWLNFLSIEDVSEMEQFLLDNPSFQDVYDCAILMLKDREGLLKMISDFWAKEDVIASLERTNKSINKRLKKENEEYKRQLEKSQSELVEAEEELRKKDTEIKRLQTLLNEKE